MTESVIGLLESREAAQRVRSALIQAGCDKNSVVIFGAEAGDGLAEELADRGLEMQRARQYAGAVMRGGIVVAAQAEKADESVVHDRG